MKLPLKILIVSVLLLLMSCGATPSRQWAAARDALTTAQETVLTLREAGIIDKEQFLQINDVRQTAKAALDVAKTQLPEGGKTFDDWMAVVNGGLNQWAALQASTMTHKSLPSGDTH